MAKVLHGQYFKICNVMARKEVRIKISSKLYIMFLIQISQDHYKSLEDVLDTRSGSQT